MPRSRKKLDARPLSLPLATVRALIDAAPAEKHTIDSLAQAAQMSRSHFVRAFGRSVGLSPHAYILRRRVELAGGLILQGCALAEAAAVSGFADQSHMTRAFRAQHGMPPLCWQVTQAKPSS